MKKLLAFGAALGCSVLIGSPAFCAGDIVFGARFYNPPRTAKGRASSHAHIYRVNPDGSGRRQVTSGTHDEQGPRWSPDGKRFSFVRDGEWVCVANADGSGQKNLLRFSNWPRWSPDSREIGMVDESTNALLFVDVQSGKKRALANVQQFAWSPDGSQLAWTTTDKKLCVANLKSKSRSRTVTALDATTIAWAGPQVLVAATGKTEGGESGGLDTFVVLDTDPASSEARVIRRLPIRANLPVTDDADLNDMSFADWRSELEAIPGAAGEFLFRWDNSTSSGRDGFYMRASAQNGVLKLLAHGQSFGSAPAAKRFAFAPYHELAPYNVPGQRPKWVYTSPLQVSGGAGKKPRTLVAGLVLIHGCDWR